MQPLMLLPRRFLLITVPLPSAPGRPPPPLLRYWPPPPSPTPLSTLHYTRRFCLRSPTGLSHPHSTSPLLSHCVVLRAGPPSRIFSRLPVLLPSPLPSSSSPSPLPCCASPLHYPCFLPAPLPLPRPPSGSCIRLICPARPLPRPRPPISPVRTKIVVIGWAGVRHAGRLQADPRHAESALTAPLPWWGAASSGPCYCTGPNSSTQCTARQCCGIRTL